MAEATRTRFYEIRDAFLTNIESAAAAVAADRSLLEVRNGIGETLLHWMVVENIVPAVQVLIASGAAVDTTNNFGATPLMEAASLGYEEMCQLLLAHGADVRYVSPRGESPLFHASRSRQMKTLRILLVQFRPDEPLAAYFDDLGLDMIFDTEDEVSELLRSRGL